MTETRNSIAETERERDPEVPLQQRASLFLAIMKRKSHSEDTGSFGPSQITGPLKSKI